MPRRKAEVVVPVNVLAIERVRELAGMQLWDIPGDMVAEVKALAAEVLALRGQGVKADSLFLKAKELGKAQAKLASITAKAVERVLRPIAKKTRDAGSAPPPLLKSALKPKVKRDAVIKNPCGVKGCTEPSMWHLVCAPHLHKLPATVRAALNERTPGRPGRPTPEWQASAEQARKLLRGMA